MKRSWLAGIGVGALLAAVWLVQGCAGMNCTERGCMDTVVINFEPALEAEGAYLFEVRADGDKPGEAATCMAMLPKERGDSCLNFSGDSLRLMTSRQPDGEGFQGLQLWGAPRSFELVIRRDGEQISRTTHRPTYETFYPNGEACDADWGGCQGATVLVDL